MTVSELSRQDGFSAVHIADGQRAIEGVYCGDILSWVMGKAECGNAWITIMSNINVAAVASLSDVACVILAEGARLDADALSAAVQKDINVLSSDKSTYQIAVALGGLL